MRGLVPAVVVTALAWGLLCGVVTYCVEVEAAPLKAYTWRTEAGVREWTDDKKRIPARYRDEAREVVIPTLEDYEWYTPADQRGQALDEPDGTRSRP